MNSQVNMYRRSVRHDFDISMTNNRRSRLLLILLTMSGKLGVDKKGTEFYQISLGGSADENASLGDITGRAFTEDTIVDAIETLVETYVDLRDADERFIDTYRRVGLTPFKERLYAE